MTGKDPVEITPADVFEFLAHQRGDRTVVRLADRACAGRRPGGGHVVCQPPGVAGGQPARCSVTVLPAGVGCRRP